jgi:poly-gamma-glutamate capsule biosynthesis protein CapA/YwtB (metallophosphatase superfamily)
MTTSMEKLMKSNPSLMLASHRAECLPLVNDRLRRTKTVVATITLLGLSLSLSFSRALGAQERNNQEFNLNLTGDSIIMTPATVHQNDPRFAALVKLIREGDASATNLEEMFPSRNAYPAPTAGGAAPGGGAWLGADPAMLKELQWMGFNLFSMANNHVFDFGTQGILDTIQVLDQAGAVYAGIGETLGKARSPGYLMTAHGRVALISCTSSFLESSVAGDPRPDMRGRPGLNPLHYQTIFQVDAEAFATLEKIKATLVPDEAEGSHPSTAPTHSGARMNFPIKANPRNGFTPPVFELSDRAAIITKADQRDVEAISRSIRDARKMADYVIVSIHAHEGSPTPDKLFTPAQFLVEFAHAAIDAGADVFMGHGPHTVRGIEIYKGKVIFYSLGGIWMQENIIPGQPQDFYTKLHLKADALPSEGYDAWGQDDMATHPDDPLTFSDISARRYSVVARVIFRDGHPDEVVLNPVDITMTPRADAGVPTIADPSWGAEVLKHLQTLSQPFGTHILIQNGVGVIKVNESNH